MDLKSLTLNFLMLTRGLILGKKAYIYSYWSDCTKVSDDFNSPIILAIATLRKHTEDSIFVIDYSNVDWENYPFLLDLHVIKKRPFFEKTNSINDFAHKTLSRNIDLWLIAMTLPEDEIVAADSDIFWLDSVGEELNKDSFHVRLNPRGVNNGCYYFCKSGTKGMLFMDYFKTYSAMSIHDEEFRKEIRRLCGLGYFNDEAVCSYTYMMHPELCEPGTFYYNGPLMDVGKKWKAYKNIHILHGWLPVPLQKHRGLLAYCFQEFQSAIADVLPQDKLSKIKPSVSRTINEIVYGNSDDIVQVLQSTLDLNGRKSHMDVCLL